MSGLVNPPKRFQHPDMRPLPAISCPSPPPPFSGVPLPTRLCGCTFSEGTPLILLNYMMFVFHLTFGIVTLVVGDPNKTVSVYRPTFRLENTSTAPGDADWSIVPTASAVDGELYLTIVTAAFFFTSAFFHLGNALLWRRLYLKGIRYCFTPSRWIEYTFSAALMSILIAYSAGVILTAPLVAVFTLTATTMFFGYLTEVLARPVSNAHWSKPQLYRLQAHILGYVPQLVAWLIIMRQFYTVVSDTSNNSGLDAPSMPDFVYAIVWGEVFVFWSFGLIQLVVTCLPPRYYPYGEVAYQIMSLVSKGLLGIILLVNVLRISS